MRAVCRRAAQEVLKTKGSLAHYEGLCVGGGCWNAKSLDGARLLRPGTGWWSLLLLAHPLNTASPRMQVSYCRESNKEVDFVMISRDRLLVIRVKSGPGAVGPVLE